jgi:transposase
MSVSRSDEQRLGLWGEVLQLAELEVVHQREDADTRTIHLTVIPRQAVGVCPCCGELSQDVHQRRDREGIRDLSIGGRQVELRVRVCQFWCRRCEQAFTPPLASLAEGTHATERFLERCATLVRHGDVARAAAFLGLPEKTLARWYYEYVERRQQQPATELQPIRSLGIDELSLKKSTASSSR